MSEYADSSYSQPLNGERTRSPNGYSDDKPMTSLAPAHGLSSVVRKKLMGYVGFANLPNQVHRKSVRKGFQFTAMVVGMWDSNTHGQFLF